jgi:hypothetical protein
MCCPKCNSDLLPIYCPDDNVYYPEGKCPQCDFSEEEKSQRRLQERAIEQEILELPF